MERGAWQTTVHGVTRVGHDLTTKPPPPITLTREMIQKGLKRKSPQDLGLLPSVLLLVTFQRGDSSYKGLPSRKWRDARCLGAGKWKGVMGKRKATSLPAV